MRGRSRRRFCAFGVVLTLVPASVLAQPAAQSFDDLQRVLKVRQKVLVTDETGRHIQARVDKLSNASLTVGGRTLAATAVREIRLADPLLNGTLIGAAVGTGLAIWDYAIDPSEPGNAAIFTIAIGLGGAIGAGIDAWRIRPGRLLYASPRRTISMRVLPTLERDRRGVRVCVSWPSAAAIP